MTERDSLALGDIVETIKGAKFWGEIIAFDNDEALPGCTVRAIDPGFEGTKHVYPLKQLRRRPQPVSPELPLGVEGEFRPVITVNEEAGVTEITIEDCAYVAEPVFPGVYHWIDKHLAMDDGRLVGMAVWKTAPQPVADAGDVAGLVEELRAGLDGVTPGPWEVVEDHGRQTNLLRVVSNGGGFKLPIANVRANIYATFNTRHIARCSPDNIAKLLDALTRQSEQIASLTKERDEARANHEYFATQWDERGYEIKALKSRLAELEQEAVKVVEHLITDKSTTYAVRVARARARAFLDKLRRPS